MKPCKYKRVLGSGSCYQPLEDEEVMNRAPITGERETITQQKGSLWSLSQGGLGGTSHRWFYKRFYQCPKRVLLGQDDGPYMVLVSTFNSKSEYSMWKKMKPRRS